VPEIIAGETPTLIGTDGQTKMSKSLNNAIFLSDSAADVRRKVRGMYTDPARVRADIPGTIEGNAVFQYLDAFAFNPARVTELKERYRAGRVGDVEVKHDLTEALNAFLEPMRERRAHFDQPGLIEALLLRGTERVRAETQATVRDVRSTMGLGGAWNRLRRRAARAMTRPS
jgi:tryptophanyl-tRNA synthetase